MSDRADFEKRVDDAIRAENYGLTSQRLAAIKARFASQHEAGWYVVHAPDGTPLRMYWVSR